MEFLDDEDYQLMLTQQGNDDVGSTSSQSYGLDIVDDEVSDGVVSLEGVDYPNFDVNGDGLMDSSQNVGRDGVQIEAISSDKEVETL